MPQLKSLEIGLNITEIPSNAIVPVGNQTKLDHLMMIGKHHNITVKSNAFQHLIQLVEIDFHETTIKTIEEEAFKLNSESEFNSIIIRFYRCNLTGETFKNGSFDGLSKPIKITFLDSDINYLSEGAFKTVLNNNLGSIDLYTNETQRNSELDCSDCRNYWLIKENKQEQVNHANCKDEGHKKLFDDDIKSKLSQKCK